LWGAAPAFSQTVSLSTISLVFSNQVIGTTSSAKKVTLTNAGTAALAVSSIQASGAFNQTNTCGSSVLAASKCTISITFSPATTGAAAGSLTINDNASNSPQAISLTGTGVLPVGLSPGSATFPSRTVGTTSSVTPFTLTNNLGSPVTINGISITGDFAQTNACPGALLAGAKCTISVTFTPTVTGNRTGTLTVVDSASNSPQTATLSGTGNTTGLVSISVTPANPTLTVGGRQQFTAIGTFNNNSTYDLTQSATWSSSSAKVAAINNTAGSKGLATAVALGTTTIKATAGSLPGFATLTVSPTLVSIAVTPGASSIALGQNQQYTATGNYSDGTKQNLTSSVSWSSSNPAAATVTNTGFAGSVGTGATTIGAVLGNVTGSTSLNVNPPTLVSLAVTPANSSIALGTTQQYKAVGTYTNGSTLDLTNSVAWTSTRQSVASISNSPGIQGLATSVAPGQTTVTASSGSVAGSAALTVTPAVLTAIVVTPAVPFIPQGFRKPSPPQEYSPMAPHRM